MLRIPTQTVENHNNSKTHPIHKSFLAINFNKYDNLESTAQKQTCQQRPAQLLLMLFIAF